MKLPRAMRAMALVLSFGLVAALAGFAGLPLAAPLNPPGLAALPVGSGERNPGSDIAPPASMTITAAGLPTITSPIFAVKAEVTSPTDAASGKPAGLMIFNGFTVTPAGTPRISVLEK